jgi:hypothetical protein
MQSILFVNPLKPGKLNEYKDFMSEITGARKQEYKDLLKRYGLKTSKVYYHKLGGQEFTIVTHDIEDYAPERLAAWVSSTHPFDLWFKEQAQKLYDFESAKIAGQPQSLMSFDAAN